MTVVIDTPEKFSRACQEMAITTPIDGVVYLTEIMTGEALQSFPVKDLMVAYRRLNPLFVDQAERVLQAARVRLCVRQLRKWH